MGSAARLPSGSWHGWWGCWGVSSPWSPRRRAAESAVGGQAPAQEQEGGLPQRLPQLSPAPPPASASLLQRSPNPSQHSARSVGCGSTRMKRTFLGGLHRRCVRFLRLLFTSRFRLGRRQPSLFHLLCPGHRTRGLSPCDTHFWIWRVSAPCRCCGLGRAPGFNLLARLSLQDITSIRRLQVHANPGFSDGHCIPCDKTVLEVRTSLASRSDSATRSSACERNLSVSSRRRFSPSVPRFSAAIIRFSASTARASAVSTEVRHRIWHHGAHQPAVFSTFWLRVVSNASEGTKVSRSDEPPRR